MLRTLQKISSASERFALKLLLNNLPNCATYRQFTTHLNRPKTSFYSSWGGGIKVSLIEFYYVNHK